MDIKNVKVNSCSRAKFPHSCARWRSSSWVERHSLWRRAGCENISSKFWPNNPIRSEFSWPRPCHGLNKSTSNSETLKLSVSQSLRFSQINISNEIPSLNSWLPEDNEDLQENIRKYSGDIKKISDFKHLWIHFTINQFR